MMGMTDRHKIFLQSFMSHGILNAQEVKNMYRYTCERYNEPHNEDQLAQFVSIINTNIKAFSLEIRKCISEDTGAHFYGLMNTTESAITRFASDFSTNELELFKMMMAHIVESDSGVVSSMTVLHLTDQLDKKMSKKEAEDLVHRLEANKWVVEHEGEISLSTRAIMELDNYLRETYPDTIVNCNVCKRLCLKGQSCHICDVKLHFHCAARFFRDQPNPSCPGEQCGAVWPHSIPQKEKKSKGSSQLDESGSRKRKL